MARQLETMREPAKMWMLAYANRLLYLLRSASITPGVMEQWDKTFLTHMLTPAFGPLREGWDLAPAPASDPLIDRFISELRAVTMAGPKSQFVGVLSSGTMEAQMNYIGPWAPSLPLVAGAIYNIGRFQQTDLDVIATFPWSAESQLRGVAEAYPRVLGALEPQRTARTVVQITGGVATTDMATIRPVQEIIIDQGAEAVPMVYDDPDVSITWDDEEGVEFQWFSQARGRMMRGIISPFERIAEKHMCNNIAGVEATSPKTGALSIDKWRFADLHRLAAMGRLVRLGSDLPVYFMDRGVYRVRTIRLGTALNPKGEWFVKPAFSEYVRPTLDALHVPNEKYEDYIIGRLQIAVPDQRASRMAVRISYNHYFITTLLGAVFGVQFELERYIGGLVTGRSSATAVAG